MHSKYVRCPKCEGIGSFPDNTLCDLCLGKGEIKNILHKKIKIYLEQL